jgi:protein TonB
MFDSLIESRRTTAARSAFGGGAVSLFVHSALIAGAVYATLHASETRRELREVGPISLAVTPKPPPRPTGAGIHLPLPGPMRLTVSAEIPPVIPPPSPVPFDPTAYIGVGPDSGDILAPGSIGPGVSPAAIYSVNVVEEQPERIGGPVPRYPEVLRQAGIEGEVVVECVVDTLGRVEPGTVRVVSSTHALFEQPARETVGSSVFRPGRLDGRPVRVRVRLPLIFKLARGNSGP